MYNNDLTDLQYQVIDTKTANGTSNFVTVLGDLYTNLASISNEDIPRLAIVDKLPSGNIIVSRLTFISGNKAAANFSNIQIIEMGVIAYYSYGLGATNHHYGVRISSLGTTFDNLDSTVPENGRTFSLVILK